ncbi:MAG TPA: helix-turn-helix domain-containing protein [Burkholderiales bacterium]|nr:helix-turn-helix domain-containing protein [Burkholderiales bacterium]
MRLQEIGSAIRAARTAHGMTQAGLAESSGLSRTTLNQLENGVFPDIGVKKVQNVLDRLGLDLSVVPAPKKRGPDFVRMACTSANVRYRETLTEDELVRALLSGKLARSRRPHLRSLLEEAPQTVLKGLVGQVGKWTKPGKVEQNVLKLAETLHVSERARGWLTNA